MVTRKEDKSNDDRKMVFRISAPQALRVAELLIEECHRLGEWRDAYASRAYPLYSPSDKEANWYFEVKISTPSEPDAGTAIVSATDADFPVIGFRTRGRTMTEAAISKSGHEVKRVIWHGSNAVTGEDAAGKEIVSLGRKATTVFDLAEYQKYRRKHKLKPLPKALPETKESEEFRQEWTVVKKALGLMKSNPDYGVTADSFDFAWGWARHANLDQYKLSNGEWVGCAPTAWSALLTYHDMYWDPDLLYGTHDSMTDYIKRSMKRFNDRMDTDDGNTYAWNIKDGYDTFEDYHCFGDLDFDPEDYVEWDWDVCVLGTEPGDEIQDLITSRISADTPVIVGLVTDRTWVGYQSKGHYCLGLGWAKNDKGKLKYVLCDELHGGGLGDLYWWHRKAVFGAWGLPRNAHDHPRWKTETDVWLADFSNLGDEIYGVGLKRPLQTLPVLVLRRGPAAGFPIPVKGTSAKGLEFDESVEVPVHELQGSEALPTGASITTWNYSMLSIADYLTRTRVFRTDFRAKDVPLTRKDFANLLLEPTTKQGLPTTALSYLFLAWSDEHSRIHIAYTVVPESLVDVSFTHVLLPERFRAIPYRRTPIAIADDGRTGPMLYVGYCDENMYPVGDQAMFSHGRLLIINLELFFKIATTGQDLWPQDSVPDLAYESGPVLYPGITTDVLTKFNSYWVPFSSSVSNISLSSNGSRVALLWSVGSYDPRLYIHWSYTFEGQFGPPGGYPPGAFYKPYWGNCSLNIAYAKYGYRFLQHCRYVETDEDDWVGELRSSRADVFYGSDFMTLISWSDEDNRLLVAKIRRPHSEPRRAELVADLFRAGRNPKLAFVEDELGNRNSVMAFHQLHGGALSFCTRILYLSGDDVGGITDFDDLPK